MKFLLAFASLFASGSVFAATVNVDSFYFLHTNSSLAELCGTVKDSTAASTLVRVAVDPRTKNKAVYTATAGADGKFCLVLASFSGEAAVSIDGSSASVNARVK